VAEANGQLPTTAPPVFLVDPSELHVPPSRPQGADPHKLALQIARHGKTTIGMPPIQLVKGKGGLLRINDGVTRATRIAKLVPGQLVPAIIIQDIPALNVARMPRIKDVLP